MNAAFMVKFEKLFVKTMCCILAYFWSPLLSIKKAKSHNIETISVSKMVENITDDCKMITTDHELRVDGHRLIEKKQTIHFKPDDDERDENGLTTRLYVI